MVVVVVVVCAVLGRSRGCGCGGCGRMAPQGMGEEKSLRLGVVPPEQRAHAAAHRACVCVWSGGAGGTLADGVVCADGAEEDIVVGVVLPDEVRRGVPARVHLAPAHAARPVRALALKEGAVLRAPARAVGARRTRRHAPLLDLQDLEVKCPEVQRVPASHAARRRHNTYGGRGVWARRHRKTVSHWSHSVSPAIMVVCRPHAG